MLCMKEFVLARVCVYRESGKWVFIFGALSSSTCMGRCVMEMCIYSIYGIYIRWGLHLNRERQGGQAAGYILLLEVTATIVGGGGVVCFYENFLSTLESTCFIRSCSFQQTFSWAKTDKSEGSDIPEWQRQWILQNVHSTSGLISRFLSSLKKSHYFFKKMSDSVPSVFPHTMPQYKVANFFFSVSAS